MFFDLLMYFTWIVSMIVGFGFFFRKSKSHLLIPRSVRVRSQAQRSVRQRLD